MSCSVACPSCDMLYCVSCESAALCDCRFCEARVCVNDACCTTCFKCGEGPYCNACQDAHMEDRGAYDDFHTCSAKICERCQLSDEEEADEEAEAEQQA